MTEYGIIAGEMLYDEWFPNGIRIIQVLDGKDSRWRVEDRDGTTRTHMTLGKAYDDANARSATFVGRFR